MTLWACGCWTYAARLRENCVKCAGKGCLCCADKGTHAEHGAKNQRDNINSNFAATISKEAMWSRSTRKERDV